MVEIQLADVFVEMADTLVDDFDLIDFLHVMTERCVQLLDVSAAGLLLTDGRDRLQVVAASSERTRLLELFQLQTDQGPCLDCFRTGTSVSVADLASAGRWPRFAAAAAEVGFSAVHALPMRLRTEVIGALNLFDVHPGALDAGKLRIGQALADVATIGLLQQRAIHRRDVVTDQLHSALNSRVLIEQAQRGARRTAERARPRRVHRPTNQRPQPQPAAIRTRPSDRRRLRAGSDNAQPGRTSAEVTSASAGPPPRNRDTRAVVAAPRRPSGPIPARRTSGP